MSTHEDDFEFWQIAYQYGACTLDQLGQAVKKNIITPDEYKTICGQDYIAP